VEQVRVRRTRRFRGHSSGRHFGTAGVSASSDRSADRPPRAGAAGAGATRRPVPAGAGGGSASGGSASGGRGSAVTAGSHAPSGGTTRAQAGLEPGPRPTPACRRARSRWRQGPRPRYGGEPVELPRATAHCSLVTTAPGNTSIGRSWGQPLGRESRGASKAFGPSWLTSSQTAATKSSRSSAPTHG